MAGSCHDHYAFNIGTLGTEGEVFGPEHYSSVSSVIRRMKQRMANNGRLRTKAETIEGPKSQEQICPFSFSNQLAFLDFR